MKLKREMSISHADFLRLVPRLLDGYEYDTDDTTITARRGDCYVTLKLGPERQRRIASLVLPVTDIEMQLKGFSDEAAQTFITRFETLYRRGGG